MLDNMLTPLQQLKEISQQTNAGYTVIGDENVFSIKAKSKQWMYIAFAGIPFIYFMYITIRNFNLTFLFSTVFLLVCLFILLRNTQGYDLLVDNTRKRLVFKRSDLYGLIFTKTKEVSFSAFESIFYEDVQVSSKGMTHSMNQIVVKSKNEDINLILLPAGQLYNIDHLGFIDSLTALIQKNK